MSQKEYRNRLKRIFTGYRRLTPQVERELSELGISVERRRNHIVLLVDADGTRKIVPISCTGSDTRLGLNIVSEICR